MDSTARELVLDENGVCNFCHQAQKSLKQIESQKDKLPEIIKEIKNSGCSCEY